MAAMSRLLGIRAHLAFAAVLTAIVGLAFLAPGAQTASAASASDALGQRAPAAAEPAGFRDAQRLARRWVAAVNARDRAWLRAHTRTRTWQDALRYLEPDVGVDHFAARKCDRRDIVGDRLPPNKRACALWMVYPDGERQAGAELYLVRKQGTWRAVYYFLYD